MHPALTELIALPEARIWQADLETLGDEVAAALDRTEEERAARFHFAEDRQRYRACRGLLRHLLGEISGQDPARLVFEYGAHGKPSLALPDRAIRFNLTHAGRWAMFAIAREGEIGIDLEALERLDHEDGELARLARRILSEREFAIWEALPELAARRAAFLRAWTRKEAYAKATGRGMSEAFETIEVILDAAAPEPTLIAPGLTNDWLLRDLPAPDGFAAAVAVARKERAVFAPGSDAQGPTARPV